MWKHLNKRTTWSCLLRSAWLGVVLWRACSDWASSIFLSSVEKPQGLFLHSLLVALHLTIRESLIEVWWQLELILTSETVGKPQEAMLHPWPIWFGSGCAQTRLGQHRRYKQCPFCISVCTSTPVPAKWGSVFKITISGDDVPCVWSEFSGAKRLLEFDCLTAEFWHFPHRHYISTILTAVKCA